MLHISTSLLQIQVSCASGLFPIPDIKIRLLQKNASILVYEDFFLTDHDGKSQNIAVYVEENGAQTYEVIIRDSNFIPIHIVCKLYAKIQSRLIIHLIPNLSEFQEQILSETIQYPSFDYILYAMQKIPPTLTMKELHQHAESIFNQSDTKSVSCENWLLIHEPIYHAAIDYYKKHTPLGMKEHLHAKMQYCASFLNKQSTLHSLYKQFYGFSADELQPMQDKVNHIYALLPHDYVYNLSFHKNLLILCNLSAAGTRTEIKRKTSALIALLDKRIMLDKRMNPMYMMMVDEILEIYQNQSVSSINEKIRSFQRLFGLPVNGKLHSMEYTILYEIKKEITEMNKAS